MRMQGGMGTVREAGVHRPRLVGAVEHFVDTLVHHQWQTLPPVRRITAQAGPAAFDVLGVCGFETCRGRDLMGRLIDLAAFGIAADVERERDLSRKFSGFLQHGVDGVHVSFGVFGHGLEVICDLEHFVHHKLHVAQRGGVGGHGELLWK